MKKYLLDTCAFLHYVGVPDEGKCPKEILDILGNPENEIYLSAISLWEIETKRNLPDRLGELKKKDAKFGREVEELLADEERLKTLKNVNQELGKAVKTLKRRIETNGKNAFQLIEEYKKTEPDLKLLPFSGPSVTWLEKLPKRHKDPYDRMLMCQAIEEKLILITCDDTIKKYANVSGLSLETYNDRKNDKKIVSKKGFSHDNRNN